MIHVQNLSKVYTRGRETVRALDNVSFELGTGKLALLRGPSGSGKTTLVNLCAGLASPTSGTIRVADHAVHTMSNAQRTAMRANTVSVVFQSFHLTSYLTAFENILLPSLASPGANAADRAHGLLQALRLEHRADHFPGEMSAGERQRCALARALLNNPAVVLADEPVGNLDTTSAELVLAQLDACRAQGATVLLVSHHPLEGLRPDVILELDEGHITTKDTR